MGKGGRHGHRGRDMGAGRGVQTLPVARRDSWQVAELARGPYVGPPSGPFQLSSDGTLTTNRWGLAPSEAAAVGLSAVWRCLCVIADSISTSPWGEWRGLESVPVSRIVRRPMSGMTRREWTWLVTATLALYNVAYVRMAGGEDSEGVPWSLVPVPPLVIAPEDPDPWGIRPPTAYRIGGERVSAEFVIRMRRVMLPSIPPELASLLSLARASLGSAISADWYAAGYWLTGAAPQVVLTTDQELTQPQADEIADSWVDKRSSDPSRPAVLGKGAHADDFGADLSAASAVEARREMTADVARYFGVPPHLVNAPTADSMTYQNVEQAGLDLVRYCLEPYAAPVEDCISDLLPGDPLEGRRMEVELRHLTLGGFTDRAQGYALATGNRPWLSPDEVRQAEGRAPSDALASDLTPVAPPPPPPPPAPVTPPAQPAPAEAPA